MKAKAVVPREQANRDIEDAVAYDLGEGAQSAALSFIDEVEEAYVHISRCPGTGGFHALRTRAQLAGAALLAAGSLPTHGLLLRTVRPHRRLARPPRQAG